MTSDPPLHVALGPDLRRPSVRLLKEGGKGREL